MNVRCLFCTYIRKKLISLRTLTPAYRDTYRIMSPNSGGSSGACKQHVSPDLARCFYHFFREINIFGHTNGVRHWLYITCFNLELVLCFKPPLHTAPPFTTSCTPPHPRPVFSQRYMLFYVQKVLGMITEKREIWFINISLGFFAVIWWFYELLH